MCVSANDKGNVVDSHSWCEYIPCDYVWINEIVNLRGSEKKNKHKTNEQNKTTQNQQTNERENR